MENNIQEIKWENRFNTGYKRVDDQHKELVNILNKLNLLVINKDITREDVSEELNNIIKDMVDYVAYHFSTEEAIMKAIDYSGFKSHVVKHRNFTNKVLEEVNNYKNGKQIDIKGLIVFLRDWLFNHIVVEDKVFINEVKSTLEKMAREEYNM
ncbi:bacteriohemerythrin [Brachyspira pilosicoli]|uniref:bacteriohemerythrin n=1 Tax=Brachyspira pilosicoli TaxID=52584 RepID=UPI0030078533